MIWLNLLTSNLRAPEFVGCCPVSRATWLCVLAHCVEQENGGTISGAKQWSDRRWQQTCGVTWREVNSSTPLLSWDNDDLRVWAYPADKQAEVEAKREAGRVGGIKSGKARREAQLQAQLQAPSEAQLEGDLERKGMEGKGRERNSTFVLPFDSVEFSEAWKNWEKHRAEIRKPLKPTMRNGQFAELKAMGEQRAIAAIKHTIAKGWQGIREPDAQQKPGFQNQNPNYGTKCELAFFPQ